MHPAVRPLFAADMATLRQLAAACDADAWERSGITFDDPHLFGLIVDGLVVAAGLGYREYATHLAVRLAGER